MDQTVLLVEDDTMIVDMLRYGLEREGYRVISAPDGVTGLALARHNTPDLALLDVMMPGLDGLQLCRILRSEKSLPIIMLTARGEETDKVVGLEMGADDYVVKPFGMRELIARIRAHLRRTELPVPAPADDKIVRIGKVTLDRNQRTVMLADQPVKLHPREYDVLSALMLQPGHTLSRNELMDAVWGDGWIGDARTLDVHIRWLREKLEDDPAAPRYILTVRGIGYRFAKPSEVEVV